MWADPRFDALKIMVGNEFVAIGIMVKAFKLAQEFWGNDRSLIPIETWDLYPFNALEKAGLAERTEAGIYVKGSEENFDWLYKKRSSGRAGGLKSVQVRQNKYGTSKVLKSSEHEAPQEALEEADKKHSEKHCFVNDEAPKNPLSLSLSLNNKYIRANKPCANKGEIADEKQSIADEIVNLWNKDLAGVLPKVSRLTTKRRTTLNAQIKKYPDLAHWQDTITKIKASDFLTGKSGVWKASFDWIMSENNRIKIIEGNYENKTKEKEKWEDKVRWL
jgi:hypothetical protein